MIVKLTMILKYQLVFLAINKLLLCNGEWVELPQFSDDSKVYKLSVLHGHDSFYNKFPNDDQKTVQDYEVKTIDQLSNAYGNTERNTTGFISSSDKNENSMHFLETATINPLEESSDPRVDNGDDIFTPNLRLEEILTLDAEASTPAVPSTLESPTEEPIISSTAIPESITSSLKKEEYKNETIQAMRFHDYLPMEMLKKVHQTLKSQPSTLKGKIRFLKEFEEDLIAEIESRLGTALTPPRRTRGAHDYYDHDDEMGFPSLEGALMAISFLTFAVYLIRLVILLFRSATATTSATILLGRKRRSTDVLNNKTQEILNYLNTFDGD